MSDIICYCFNVEKDRIVAAIEGGCETAESIRERLGASGNCASCLPDIEALIDFYKRFPASTSTES